MTQIFGLTLSKVVSTHLCNTPLNLYQQAIKGKTYEKTSSLANGGLPKKCAISGNDCFYQAGLSGPNAGHQVLLNGEGRV